MSDHSEHVHFRFQLPVNPDDTDELRIVAWFKEAKIHMTWVDDGKEGTRDMNSLLATMPHILRSAREERQVSKDLKVMNAELDNIFEQEQPGD